MSTPYFKYRLFTLLTKHRWIRPKMVQMVQYKINLKPEQWARIEDARKRFGDEKKSVTIRRLIAAGLQKVEEA